MTRAFLDTAESSGSGSGVAAFAPRSRKQTSASTCCGGLGTRSSFINVMTAVDALHSAYIRVSQPPKPIEKGAAGPG
jgi:hypothetical protein